MDLFYMEKVNELAQKNVLQGGGPFGAILVSPNGKLFVEGTNQVIIHKDPTLHAEISAIRNTCQIIQDFQLTGYTLYSSCEPCPMCLSACYWARIGRIVYGNTREEAKAIGFDDSLIYEEVSKPMKERSLPMEQIRRQDSMKAFQMWTEKEDKIKY
jgi:tRNA(Arg) A34 adenosine deaminase TadA